MVFMEFIKLEDSKIKLEDSKIKLEDIISETKGNSRRSRMSRTLKPRNPTRKRRKRKSNNIRKVKRVLSNRKKNIEDIKTTNHSFDLDATLDPETLSPCFINIDSDDNTPCSSINTNKRRRQQRSSIVVIDSEDDCVMVNNNQLKNNNNLKSDVLYLSDSSIIELSDSEDIGVVTGLIETSKNENNWKGKTSCYEDTSQTACCSTTRSTITLELRKAVQDDHQSNQLRQHHTFNIEETSMNQMKTNHTEVLTIKKQDSRHSISYLPLESYVVKKGPRPIVIDGCNVAFGHGKERFSAKGIQICIDYFLRRKHTEVRAFVPQFRRRHVSTVGVHILDKLEKEGYLVYTPSRQVDGKRITSYDDRFIVEYATKTGGIIVTRDNYLDLLAENRTWSDTINFRLLQYTFVGDMIMFPQDPLGRGGPTLDKFLMF